MKKYAKKPKMAYSRIGHVNKYQTQLCISKKLKKSFLWITSVYLNFRHWNFSHRGKSPHFHSGKSYVKKITVYFLPICTNFSYKIEKFELEVVGMGILWTGFFCFQGSH